MQEDNNNNKPRIIRCIKCQFEITEGIATTKLSSCPECNTSFKPSYVDHDVNIRVNWNELYLLCAWARNWEDISEMEEDIVGIIGQRLNVYKPLDAMPLPTKEKTHETEH